MAKPNALPREEVVTSSEELWKNAIEGSFIAEADCVKNWFELGAVRKACESKRCDEEEVKSLSGKNFALAIEFDHECTQSDARWSICASSRDEVCHRYARRCTICRRQMHFVAKRTALLSAAQYTQLMNQRTTTRVSLTALLGTPVTDAQGTCARQAEGHRGGDGAGCGQGCRTGAEDADRAVAGAFAGGARDAGGNAGGAVAG